MPTIGSNVGTVNDLLMGWTTAQASDLTIGIGGSLGVVALARLGHLAGSTSTIDMTGGLLNIATFHVGFSGDGIVNMSGDAVLDVAGLGFGYQFAAGGTGAINMEGNSLLKIDGDLSGAGGFGEVWTGNGSIVAINGGDSISYSYNGGTGQTEFTVIPEPATLGMFALMGGGMLWIRKRRMV